MAGTGAGRIGAIVLGGLAVVACAAATNSPSPAPGASVEPPTVERSLVANGIEYQPAMLTIPTGTKLVIAFDNTDPGVPHQLVLYADPQGSITLAEAPLLVGPDRERFDIPPLVVGRYRISCRVHPNMSADLVVTPD